MVTYGLIFLILLVLELVYFKVADKFNIIDKPNERSSHSTIVLRGGGIIFVMAAWLWLGYRLVINDLPINDCYPCFLFAVTLVAGISFVDDIHSLPDKWRLFAQFVAMAMMFYQLDILHVDMWWVVVLALIVCVGATNIINFMDGINGITGAYAMASLVPLALLNNGLEVSGERLEGFVEQSLIYIVMLADVVFCLFNFRPRGKAKCFAGDVGSIGVAFILLFLIGKLVMKTGDPTYLIFLVVYGFDGCLTICHRIMLHENLGEAHRKHAFQLMANELKMSHITVSLFYALLQLAISLVFIFVIPNDIVAHVVYLLCVSAVLVVAYVLFMKKYYHLHEEYLESLRV